MGSLVEMNQKKVRQVIRLSKSTIGEAEKKAVLRVLDKEYLGMGDEVHAFEEELKIFFGRPVVCVSNGTAALHLALQACGIGDGDEVLVPSLTYVASYQAITATGAVPVACDIHEKNCILDLRDAERKLTSRTKAIMPVHYTGDVGDFNSVINFANKNRLRIIEDAAHAFGTTYEGKKVGSFGDIACFSFDGIKNITTGEGGCVVSSDLEIIAKIQDARLLGVERDTDMRYSGNRSWQFNVREQGWRYHMSNIMAAIGLEQLKRFPEIALKRQSCAKLYDKLLSNHPGIKIFNRDYTAIVPHIYVVRIPGLTNRQHLRDALLSFGIQTGVHYQPNHLLSFFRADHEVILPITDNMYPELLTLPLHEELSKNDIEWISNNLKMLIQ